MSPLFNQAGWPALAFGVSFAIAIAIPGWLHARNEAVLLANPKLPIPEYGGAVVTINHNEATMKKIASSVDELSHADFASSFDMYYEAQLENCDPDKNVVVLNGTNGPSWTLHPFVEALRKKGYCTLNLDYRGHGRSSSSPGEYTAELFGEDIVGIIQHVFRGKSVHLFGWSFGGLISYYLALEHPELVRSIAMTGMTSCMGFITHDGACDSSFLSNLPYWLLSREYLNLLLGTENMVKVAASYLRMQENDLTKSFWLTNNFGTLTRMPKAWARWRKDYYHEAIRNIKIPVLLLAGEHDEIGGYNEEGLAEDVARLAGEAYFTIFPHFSHFLLLEERDGSRGSDLAANAFEEFHAIHFS